MFLNWFGMRTSIHAFVIKVYFIMFLVLKPTLIHQFHSRYFIIIILNLFGSISFTHLLSHRFCIMKKGHFCIFVIILINVNKVIIDEYMLFGDSWWLEMNFWGLSIQMHGGDGFETAIDRPWSFVSLGGVWSIELGYEH